MVRVNHASSHRGRRRLLMFASVASVLLLGLWLVKSVFFTPAGRVRITVSRETTRITRPLCADGYVNYRKALNQTASDGITPGNNAVVLIWQALGPEPVDSTWRAEYFSLLGTPVPPTKGEYFVALDRFAQNNSSSDANVRGAGPRVDAEHMWRVAEQAVGHPWREASFPELAKWLAINKKPLALIVQASARPRWYTPVVGNQILLAPFPLSFSMRDVVQALCVRASLRLGEGKLEDAWSDIMACHRLARLQSQSPVLAIPRLAAVADEGMACRADLVLLQYTHLSRARATRMRADVRSLAPMTSLADILDTGERFCGLESACIIARGGGQSTSDAFGELTTNSLKRQIGKWSISVINWDTVLKALNLWYDRCVAAAHKPTHAERAAAYAKCKEDLKHARAKQRLTSWIGWPLSTRSATSNHMAYILVDLLVPAESDMGDADDRASMNITLVELGFSLAAYRADHGTFPTTLSALTPDYAATIPDDMFTGKPLHYLSKKDGYLLYSVGPDQGRRWI